MTQTKTKKPHSRLCGFLLTGETLFATHGHAAIMRHAASRGSGGLLQLLHGLEHLVDVAGDLDAPPFGPQHALGVDQKGAALDALDLLAVHDLVLDHPEHVAQLLL